MDIATIEAIGQYIVGPLAMVALFWIVMRS